MRQDGVLKVPGKLFHICRTPGGLRSSQEACGQGSHSCSVGSEKERLRGYEQFGTTAPGWKGKDARVKIKAVETIPSDSQPRRLRRPQRSYKSLQ